MTTETNTGESQVKVSETNPPIDPAIEIGLPDPATVKDEQAVTTGESDLSLDEEGLRASLSKVVDPELHMNIVELGLVYKAELVNQGDAAPDVEVEMTLTSPGCPYGPMILGMIPSTLKKDYGSRINEVNVGLTFTPPWDPATMASEDVQFELGIF